MSLNMSACFKFFLSFGSSPWLLSMPCLQDCWPVLLHPLSYCWFPLVYFSFIYYIVLLFLKICIFCLYVELLTEFMHCSLMSVEYLYDHLFELCQVDCLSAFHLAIFLRFLVLSFGTYSSVFSLCPTLCVTMYQAMWLWSLVPFGFESSGFM